MRYVAVLLGLGLSATAIYTAENYNFTSAQRNWWAFQPVARPAPPKVKKSAWAKNPIDAFVLARLEQEGLTPNPPADRLTLLRRATVDITGLQPTPEEIAAFQADQTPDAWEKVVDRLLAAPAYGERWGRHWLDVVRYADSNGFKADETRPDIWRYRDYVIDAFNSDKPFDRFVREQIAGDELYPGDHDALVAMGFNRHWTDESNAAGLITRRQETLDDITSVTGQAFLGMTFGCARCHNHKYDPILQSDYYRLQAFFANTGAGDGPLPLKDPKARAKYEAQYATWDEKTKNIRAEMARIVEPLRNIKAMGGIKTFEEPVKVAILKPASQRTPWEAMMYHTAEPRIGFDEEPDARTLRSLAKAELDRYNELKVQLAAFAALKPKALPTGQYMIDIGPVAPPTYVLLRGSVDAKGPEVQPGFLTILNPKDPKITPLENSTGRRSVLANWLADRANPLVGRVMANRIWHYHFGRGIVATPGDFGRMGSAPTHPELLDYLTTYFTDNGWSMKKLHRLILTSNTYQQSSEYRAAAAETDSADKLLWRWPRRRMEAEAVRDSLLQVSGLLNRSMHGPGVYPPVPPGTVSAPSATASNGGWHTQSSPSQINRRSVYIFVRRNLRYPMLEEFDSANTFESHSVRMNTVTPAQSLDLLNNGLVEDWAKAFAARVLNDKGLTTQAQVDRAYRLALGRTATAEEHKVAEEFLAKQTKTLAAKPDAAHVAFVDFCHMLLDSNEFLYLN